MKGHEPNNRPGGMERAGASTTVSTPLCRRIGRRTRNPVSTTLILAIALAVAACSPAPSSSSPEANTATTLPSEGGITADAESSLQIQAVLEDARVGSGARGALAFVRSDDREWAVASGDADAAGTPVTFDMRFRIGSITKPLVAALILDQVAQGSIFLDDDVFALIGPPLRAEPPVTVAMLLDHTSGIFDIGNDGDPMADVAQLNDPDLIAEVQSLITSVSAGESAVASDQLVVALAETHARYFAPGSGFHYSNTNYQLAAMVLEAVTGVALADLLTRRITEPLGLEHTTWAPADLHSPDLRGFSIDLQTGSVVDATDDLLAFGNGGSGGIISTAAELTRILTAIVHGPLLPDELRTKMRDATRASGETYGLGLATYDLSCGTFYGHEGRVNGTASIALIDAVVADRSVVVAVNRTDSVPGLVPLAESLVCSAVSP